MGTQRPPRPEKKKRRQTPASMAAFQRRIQMEIAEKKGRYPGPATRRLEQWP